MKILEIKQGDFSTCSTSSRQASSKFNTLNNFLRENRASFLQSLEWGEFLRATGQEVKNLIVEENSIIVAVAQVIKRPLVLGKFYWHCSRGPIFNFQFLSLQDISRRETISNQFSIAEIFKLFIKYLHNLGRDAVFLRIDPDWSVTEKEKIEVLKKLGFKKSLHEIQPKDTLILDIVKSEEELLKEMHQKTRYNIRLAEKRGVQVRQSAAPEDLERFYKLLKTTARRDKFFLHKKEYYQKQLEILGKTGAEQLFLAEYNGKTIAGILVLFFGDTAIYLHGASDNEFRNLMAPHLLQWSAILEAKKRGRKTYDFWGIASTNAPENHPWAGVTRFKRGFGGKEVNYIGAYDFVFNKFWHWLYNLRRRSKI